MREADLQYYFERITEEESFFALIEAGDDILPRLEAQFRQELSPEGRAALTQIIWQHRNPQSLDFLILALIDPDELVWQEALTGLMTIGGAVTKEKMHAVLPAASPSKREWIIDVIDQIEE